MKQINDFIELEFGLSVDCSQLKLYSHEDYDTFRRVNGFLESDGIFIPQSMTAYVDGDNPYWVSNVFHEYYGHGLFCEHSAIGKELVDIVNSGGNANEYLSSESDKGIVPQNLANYEGFAVWLQGKLCNHFGMHGEWDRQLEEMNEPHRQLYEIFCRAEEDLTTLGFLAQLGFPKYYDSGQVLDLVKAIYKDNFNDIKFVMLYGSQKPESDIDLFVVAGTSFQYFNGWLDIYQLSEEEFRYKLDNLDLSVVGPLFSGQPIFGTVDEYKDRAMECEITEEMIKYNLMWSQGQLAYALDEEPGTRDYNRCMTYALTYNRYARELEKGNKVMTLQDLKEKYPEIRLFK